jgi:phosphoadenosine phosphosulfate reductase
MADLKQTAEMVRAKTEGMDDATFFATILREFRGRIVFASSFGAEDQVLTHLLWSTDGTVPIITLDTGRLPQETYDVMDATSNHFGKPIQVLFPDAEAVETMVRGKGVNLFYDSIENRKACCDVRKVQPLKRELGKYQAWITGMRRSQSLTRTDLQRVEYDQANTMVKFNPLIDWSREAVWAYVRGHGLPYNALHDRGFPSIGCLPCTRSVEPGEDERAGRWWWEQPGQKECGIHIQDGKAVRTRKDLAPNPANAVDE